MNLGSVNGLERRSLRGGTNIDVAPAVALSSQMTDGTAADRDFAPIVGVGAEELVDGVQVNCCLVGTAGIERFGSAAINGDRTSIVGVSLDGAVNTGDIDMTPLSAAGVERFGGAIDDDLAVVHSSGDERSVDGFHADLTMGRLKFRFCDDATYDGDRASVIGQGLDPTLHTRDVNLTLLDTASVERGDCAAIDSDLAVVIGESDERSVDGLHIDLS